MCVLQGLVCVLGLGGSLEEGGGWGEGGNGDEGWRRLDITLYEKKCFVYGLFQWTGSTQLNREMRRKVCVAVGVAVCCSVRCSVSQWTGSTQLNREMRCKVCVQCGALRCSICCVVRCQVLGENESSCCVRE